MFINTSKKSQSGLKITHLVISIFSVGWKFQDYDLNSLN